MKRNLLHLLLIFAISTLIIGCSDFNNTVSPKEENFSYLFSSSFEDGTIGWNSPGPPRVKVSSFTPPGGGKLSVLLKSQNFGGTINTLVPIPEGKNIYRFTFFAKIGAGSGFAALYLESGNEKIFQKRVFVSDTAWTKYLITDTLTSVKGDGIRIVLTGSNAERGSNISYFDLCTLEKANN